MSDWNDELERRLRSPEQASARTARADAAAAEELRQRALVAVQGAMAQVDTVFLKAQRTFALNGFPDITVGSKGSERSLELRKKRLVVIPSSNGLSLLYSEGEKNDVLTLSYDDARGGFVTDGDTTVLDVSTYIGSFVSRLAP